MLSTLVHKNKKSLYVLTYQCLFLAMVAALGMSACSETTDRMSGTAEDQEPCSTMVLIPAGNFSMGIDELVANRDEKPAHAVSISAFYIDCYEVTNTEYRKFVLATGHKPPRVEAAWAKPYNWTGNNYPPGTGMHPVVLVNWHDATAYATWSGKRLPSEAEWEKAARAGMHRQMFSYGDTIEPSQANYFASYLRSRKLRPAGTFEPNAYGLYDIAGNVWEWCQDWYRPDYYRKTAKINPPGPLHGEYKVLRGGSWKSDAKFLRCSQRGKNSPDHKSPVVGFRCVRSAD